MRSVALSKIINVDEINSHLQTRRPPPRPSFPTLLTPTWENPDEAPPNLLPTPHRPLLTGEVRELEFVAWQGGGF